MDMRQSIDILSVSCTSGAACLMLLVLLSTPKQNTIQHQHSFQRVGQLYPCRCSIRQVRYERTARQRAVSLRRVNAQSSYESGEVGRLSLLVLSLQ